MTPEELARTIAQAVRDGRITRLEGERLAGFVLLESAVSDYVEPDAAGVATFYRRCRQLRRLGLLEPGRTTAPVRVPSVAPEPSC